MAPPSLHPSAASSAKRAFDIAAAFVLLVCAMPVLVLAAAAIVLSDACPIIHRRRCVGLGGVEFDAFKLRTMVRDADARLAGDPAMRAAFERQYKLPDDPRVTRIGRLLRAWSIDELPQLVNVLRGEMSLVGPRMMTRPELARYGPGAPALLTVRPGLTGLWQVSGRQTVSTARRAELDLTYLATWSFGRDLGIVLKTPGVMLGRRGAH